MKDRKFNRPVTNDTGSIPPGREQASDLGTVNRVESTTYGGPERVYCHRRPERTVLCRLVQQHLETWLARSLRCTADGRQPPK
jgi:hypothetical protein